MRTTVSIERTYRTGGPVATEEHTFDSEAEAEAFADDFAERRTWHSWVPAFNPMNERTVDPEDRESLRWELVLGPTNPITRGRVTRLCQDSITIHVYEETA